MQPENPRPPEIASHHPTLIMKPQNPNKKTVSREEWEKRLSQVPVQKSNLNQLIMNYLIIEGYKDAAECFAQEAQLQPTVQLESIKDRMKIRELLQKGEIDAVIELVNDLNVEILSENPWLLFRLLRQKLIELIRQGRVEEAIEFAEQELAQKGEDYPEFLEDLEQTMALLAFPPDQISSSPLKELLEMSQRQKTAGELNAAILSSQNQDKDPKLPTLLKLLDWGQNELQEKLVFPKMDVNGDLHE